MISFSRADVLALFEREGVTVVQFGVQVRLERGDKIRLLTLPDQLAGRTVTGLAFTFGVPHALLFQLERRRIDN